MTSAETAARFRSRYAKRMVRLHGKPEPKRETAWPAATFREDVLATLGRYTTKRVSQIYRDLLDDWGGYFNIRRVERHLRRLTCEGAVVRTQDGYRRAR